MPGVFREIELEVSADLVRKCPGLALDVGMYYNLFRNKPQCNEALLLIKLYTLHYVNNVVNRNAISW